MICGSPSFLSVRRFRNNGSLVWPMGLMSPMIWAHGATHSQFTAQVEMSTIRKDSYVCKRSICIYVVILAHAILAQGGLSTSVNSNTALVKLALLRSLTYLIHTFAKQRRERPPLAASDMCLYFFAYLLCSRTWTRAMTKDVSATVHESVRIGVYTPCRTLAHAASWPYCGNSFTPAYITCLWCDSCLQPAAATSFQCNFNEIVLTPGARTS